MSQFKGWNCDFETSWYHGNNQSEPLLSIVLLSIFQSLPSYQIPLISFSSTFNHKMKTIIVALLLWLVSANHLLRQQEGNTSHCKEREKKQMASCALHSDPHTLLFLRWIQDANTLRRTFREGHICSKNGNNQYMGANHNVKQHHQCGNGHRNNEETWMMKLKVIRILCKYKYQREAVRRGADDCLLQGKKGHSDNSGKDIWTCRRGGGVFVCCCQSCGSLIEKYIYALPGDNVTQSHIYARVFQA